MHQVPSQFRLRVSDDGRRLSLADCELVSAPEWLSSLTDLTELDLSGNQLADLPDWLGNFTALTGLNLAGNRLAGLPDSLGNLTALAELDLRRNKLTALPDSLGNLSGLVALNLTGNQLTALPRSLGNLNALAVLGLRRNQLTALPEWLGNLGNLKVLQLGGNQLATLPDSVANLTALAELDLRHTDLAALPEWLGNLTALEALHLGGTELAALPDSLGNLTGLKTLFLLDTQLSTVPDSLGNLAALRVLGLGGSQLATLPDSLGNLTGLTTLVVLRTQLTVLPDSLANLTALTELHLADNQLVSLPDSLGKLTALTKLDLRHNQLTSLPDSLGGLIGLTELHAGDNQLSTLPDSLGNLTALTKLNLGNNNLTILPEWAGKLTCLTELSLRRNQLTRLPDSVGNLTTLTELHLGSNQLAALPDSLGNLTALGDLGLGGNQLTALPESLRSLRNLRELGLRRNRLTDLPEWLGDLADLDVLNLDGNPLRSPLLEISEDGPAAVKAYLSLAADHDAELWKSKLLVVGEGSVGKTSLVKVLAGQEFDRDEPTTHEIRIEDIEFAHPDRPDVKMHLASWDFGGQEIYHATHQFFITDRSLFLLLWNARQGWEQAKLGYWLDVIQARAPHGRVMLVATFADGRPVDLPLADLMAAYPQIVASTRVDSGTGEGIIELRRTMAYEAAKLPLMGSRWPATWVTGVEEINKCSEQYATPEYLYGRLTEAGVTEPSHQRYLLRVMHLLGDILFFDEDEELCDIVMLRPQWVSGYIARVLDSPEVAAQGGLLSRSHERQCWSDLDPGLRDRFLRMMEKFDLSYRIPEDPAAACLVVECLPWDRPPYETTWKLAGTELGAREIRLRYQLGSLPPGIPTWFIAREHRFRCAGLQWRTGALLRHADGSRALGLILVDRSSSTVDLAVRGPVPQYFFATLKDGFESTLSRYPGLKPRKIVPCICDQGNGDQPGRPCTYSYEYDLLILRLEKGRKDVECGRSMQLVNLSELLFGISPTTDEQIMSQLHTIGQQAYEAREFLKSIRRDQKRADAVCPSIFTLTPASGRSLPGIYRLDLRLYCEQPGAFHPTEQPPYSIKQPEKWLKKIGPYLSTLVAILKHAAPLAGPVLGIAADQLAQQLSNEVSLMTELVSQLSDDLPSDPLEAESLQRPELDVDYRALLDVLEEVDPGRRWGGLSRIVTPEDQVRWLCRDHAQQYRA